MALWKTILKKKNTFFLGASGGAWAALILAYGKGIEVSKIEKWTNDIVKRAQNYPYLKGLGHFDKILRGSELFQEFINIPDLYKEVQGKLGVTLTKFSPAYSTILTNENWFILP